MFEFSAQQCFALDPSAPLTDYLVKTWTTREGLPQTSVSALCNSKLGYLWLGTDDGIARFDGASFAVFNSDNTPGLPNSVAHALLEDRQGRLWVGTYNGLAVIAGGKAKTFALGKGTIRDGVMRLAEDHSGVIWAGTAHGDLYAIKDDQIQEHLGVDSLGSGTKSFSPDAESGLWIAPLNGVSRLQNGQLTQYAIFDGGKPVKAFQTFEDQKHARWAVTSTSLFLFEKGAFRKFLQFSSRDLVIRAAAVDEHGIIWIGTSAGLYRIRDRQVDTLGQRDGLAGELVLAILPDGRGGLWVGSDGGLNYFRDRHFSTFPRNAGPNGRSVWSVVDEPDDGIWLATTIGAEHITAAGDRIYTIRDGLPSNFVYCVQRDAEGSVWIGTDKGLSRWKDGRILTFSPADGLPNTPIFSIYGTHSGKLLVSAEFTGVFEFDGTRFSLFFPTVQRVYSMTDDNAGTLYVSTSNGLYRWKAGKMTRIGTVDIDYTSARPDRDSSIWAFERLGTLVRIRSGEVLPVREPGSPLRALYDLLEDEQGNFWITSNHGLLRVSKKELNDYLDGRVKEVFAAQYGVDDGLPTADFNGGTQNTMWKGMDGRFWMATPRGAVVFDPRTIQAVRAPPATLIEAVTADGRVLATHMTVKLPADVTRLEFKYTGIDFSTPQQVQFRYRIENFDRGWMDAGTSRVASYMNLPQGNYTFHVQARSRDGVWNEEGASFAFWIAPHYYRTWWFYLSSAAFAGCLMFAAHLLRVAQVRRATEAALELRMEERARIARELHDTLLQGIAGIAMQLRALMQRVTDSDAKLQLGEILDRMESSSKETRLALRDLRLSSENPRDLRTSLESFGRAMVMDTDQRFELEVTGEAFELSGELTQNLLRIGQEAILNAAKHSEASEIRVTIAFEAQGLTLTVADDGKGFEANEKAGSGHWGLVGMRERATNIGGRIEIAARPGSGTRVTVAVPTARLRGRT